ncbi:uncharacterized protein LODBEIA_P58630 [Lodderomyces beijingensis]|uniref:Calcium-transporting ATPase n=1 Tax=Lodderomyces beijingensis TaxID=1775926 RepID=A0ABP0ZU25_9ASCO
MSSNPYEISPDQAKLPHRANVPSLKFSQKTVEETAGELDTDVKTGLTNSQDVLNRKSIYGANELNSEEEDSLVMKFIKSFYQDPLILLLIGSAVISFWMGNKDDAISITLAIVIVVTVGFVQEYRSEKSLEALNKLVPAEAHLTRNSNTTTVLASTLVPGDVVYFSTGDRIPADIRIANSVYLTIDESNLTGENQPVQKNSEVVTVKDPSVTERTNIAFMGTLVREGHGSGIVVGIGAQTVFGTVFEMMSQIEKPKTPLQQAMDKLGKELSLFSFFVIGIICIIGVCQGRSWLDMFQISVSLAVAAIPEGLPIIVTVTLALGVLRLAKKKAIVKRLPSVETLGSVNVICSDKTGTLTENHMTVTKIWTTDFKGSFNTPFLVAERLDDSTLHHKLTANIRKVLLCGNVCNNAKYSSSNEKYVGNPSDIALLECLPHFGLEDIRGSRERISELPFSSDRKYMAVCVHTGDMNKAETFAKGATEKIVKHCNRYFDEHGEVKPLTDEIKESIAEKSKMLAHDGLRVLGFAENNRKFQSEKSEKSQSEPEDLIFCGLVGMKDPPRANVGQSITTLMKGGVHVIMITGDSPSTAMNIAKQIGMPITGDHSVMTGDQIDELKEGSLAEAIHNVSVFARTTPEHKVKIVKALQRRGDVVAMTGDGVNDAPALKLADIGIAMGRNGTDVAREAADMVLTDDDFSTILAAIEEGKGIFYNIQNFITFQLSTSIAALTLVAVATFFGLPNPLNAMQILWINILMDGPPAQSLGVEPVDHEVMNKPPRKRSDQILTPELLKRVAQSAIVIIIGTMYVFVSEMRDGEVTSRDLTMTFTAFVFFDMFNALACRHHTNSIFTMGLHNKMFNLSVLGSLLGQLCAIYVPFFQSIFQTEALSLRDLLHLVLLCSSVFFVDELRKWWERRKTIYTNNYNYGV